MGAVIFDSTRPDEERAEARRALREDAEGGSAAAQYLLGMMHELGKGMRRSPKFAAYWYEKAALQGMADAQYLLGNLYEFGDGVDPSPEEAARWYRMAAEQGDEEAAEALGRLTAHRPRVFSSSRGMYGLTGLPRGRLCAPQGDSGHQRTDASTVPCRVWKCCYIFVKVECVL